MRERFLRWVASKRPLREIRGDHGEPYLDRYYLFSIGPCSRPWVVGYMHHFVDSDPDRGLHDHPWAWAVSWVLTGGYYELVRPDDPKSPASQWLWRRPGAVLWFSGHHQHRVVLDDMQDQCKPAPAWTLFVHGPWVKPWGFFEYCWSDGNIAIRLYREYAAKSSAGWWKRKACGGDK